MSRARLLIRALWLFGLATCLALPTEALACPNCAMRTANPWRNVMIVVMILLPWTVFSAGYFFVKRQMRGEPQLGGGPDGGSNDDHLHS